MIDTFQRLPRRIVATATHLIGSACIAALAAFLVFGLWYPSPYTELAGGAGLFLIMMGVDVVMGPALTAVIANPSKPRPEFVRDLAIIVVLQLCALIYGLHTMAIARPVVLSFEVDRFRLVTAAEIDEGALAQAPQALRDLSWTGPRVIAAVKPTDPAAQVHSIELGLSGVDLSMVPANWRNFEENSGDAWRRARPVAQLLSRYPQLQPQVAKMADQAGRPVQELRFLPVISRRASGVAIVSEPGARVQGVLPVDGFI